MADLIPWDELEDDYAATSARDLEHRCPVSIRLNSASTRLSLDKKLLELLFVLFTYWLKQIVSNAQGKSLRPQTLAR